MAASPNEKELATFGFVTARMRSGLITAILGMLIISNIYMIRKVFELEDERHQQQRELYDRLINYLKPPVDHLNEVATKVDSVATTIQQKGNQP